MGKSLFFVTARLNPAADTLKIATRDGVVSQSFLVGDEFVQNGMARPTWAPDGAKIAFNGTMYVDDSPGCEQLGELVFVLGDTGAACWLQVGLPTVYTIDIQTGVKTCLFTPTYVHRRGADREILSEVLTFRRSIARPRMVSGWRANRGSLR